MCAPPSEFRLRLLAEMVAACYMTTQQTGDLAVPASAVQETYTAGYNQPICSA